MHNKIYVVLKFRYFENMEVTQIKGGDPAPPWP